MSDFASRLIVWQRLHGRHDLPWQRTRDPYRVWLSEIMLQQTQVDTVIPYYLRFLERFPDAGALAAGSMDEVLALWSGLGYYARARNLHRAARIVMQERDGVFPQTAAELETLPGIGRSTAAAIASFCFGERVAILDGNVKRVLCRHSGIDGYPGLRQVEQTLWQLAERLLPDEGVDVYPQALMDLGATLCTRSMPKCRDCPVGTDCVARKTGRVAELPAPRPAKLLPHRKIRVLLLLREGRVLLQRRPANGIWGGLYGLPEITDGEPVESAVLRWTGCASDAGRRLATQKHAFTHFHLEIEPWLFELARLPDTVQDSALCWIPLDNLDEIGLPSPVRKILDQLR